LTTARLVVFGLEYDHGVVANFHDVAGAQFLSGFHAVFLWG
jgi:hypothetical protein